MQVYHGTQYKLSLTRGAAAAAGRVSDPTRSVARVSRIGNYSGDRWRLDADSDHDIDASDPRHAADALRPGASHRRRRRSRASRTGYAAISNYVADLSGDQSLQRIPAATTSRLGNPFAHHGLVLDPEIGSYQNRARHYHPQQRRFMQRDPLALAFRSKPRRRLTSLYEFVGHNPCHLRDPSGLTDPGDCDANGCCCTVADVNASGEFHCTDAVDANAQPCT